MPFQKGNQCWKSRKSDTTKHGMAHTRIYQCWSDMKQRCDNPHNQFYYRYGGRGIKICDEWRDFPTFCSWALSHGYREDLTIERIDNDGDYCPDNCKWATQQEQSLNKTHLPSKTGFVGIRFRANRYQAEFTRNCVSYYVGRFKTLEEAVAARAAALEAWEIDNNRGFKAEERPA